ncbi:MAG: hypothetical protein V2A77_11675 [Pseudomonadota bacterium]
MNKAGYTSVVILALVAGLIGGLVASRLAFVPAAWAQNRTPKTIEAEDFRLVDAERNLRALLRVEKGGQPELTLWDTSGMARAALRLNHEQEPVFDMWSKGGVHAALTMVGDVPGMAVYVNGQRRTWLAVVNGVPRMQLWDEVGRQLPSGL